MSDEHGRCRMELEAYTIKRQVWYPVELILADALDRIEARLDAESTAGQAARHTAEKLIVMERDDWKRRAEFAELERNQARAERDEARAEREEQRRVADGFRRDRDEWKLAAEGLEADRAHWYQTANQWSRQLAEARTELATARATAHDAAPAATADDGRAGTDRPAPPPVVGTGATTTGEEPTAWAAVARDGRPLWLAYTKRDAEGMVTDTAKVVPLYTRPQPVPVVKLPKNPCTTRNSVGFQHGYLAAESWYRKALDSAGVKWEEE